MSLAITRKGPGRRANGEGGKKTSFTNHRQWINRPTRQLSRDNLDTAKACVTISVAWRALGLLGEPRHVCSSPFREDRNPSFSITDDRLWHDFATGEGGDVVDFVQRACGCTDAEAIRRVLELGGGGFACPPATMAQGPTKGTKPRFAYDGLAGLDLQPPTLREIIDLADLRRWPFSAGLQLAANRGLLRMADVKHRGETHRSWLLTDDARKSAQARRLDGAQWVGDGHTFKSKSLRTEAEHPPGLADVLTAARPAVFLCEGEADTLAALTFAWLADLADRVGVIALPGASKVIPHAMLEKLRGRKVRILRQADPAGRCCALVWAESLHAAGVTVDLTNLDALACANGQPAKDIADLLCRPAELENLEPIAAALLAGLNK